MSRLQKGLFVGLSCGGSLPSAIFDLVHMTEHAISRMNMSPSDIVLIVESEDDKSRVQHLFQKEAFFNGKQESKVPMLIPIIQTITRKDIFFATVKSILETWQSQCSSSSSSSSPEIAHMDILVMISTHGYCVHHTSSLSAAECKEDSGCDSSIHLDGDIIIDDELHAAIVGPLQSPKISLLALMDTCHSGTLLDLPFWTIDLQHSTTDGKVDPSCFSEIHSISACSDTESSMDDVSVFGFDGGLIAAFLDSWKPQIALKELYTLIRYRLRKGGQTSILSSNKPLQ